MHTTEPETEVRAEILQILDAMEDAVILADSYMNVRTVTPSMERLAGISADDARGADATRIVADRILPEANGDQRERILSLLQNRAESGGITVGVSSAAGERRYVFSSRRVKETGDWIVRFRDVTRREAAEEEVRRTSGDLAFLSRVATELASMPDEADVFSAIGARLHELAPGSVVIVSAADIRAGTLSPRAFFGIEPFLPEITEAFGEDLTRISLEIPSSIRAIMARGEIEEVKGGLQEIALGQISQEISRKFEDIADLGAMYCIPFTWKGEIFGSAVILTRQEGGEVNFRAIKIFQSLASIALQRHRAEAELRGSEKTFRALIEKGSEFILVIDDQLTIRFASPPIEQIDGFPPETLIGRHAFDMIQPEDLPRVKEVVSTLAEKPGGSAQFEVRFRGPRGTHVIEAIVTNLLGDPHIRGFVVNAWDITERKRAQEALQRHTEDLLRLQSELEVSNREANLYLDILTHDIRNTENVSNLYIELLADTLDGEIGRYVENLQRSIQKSIEILGTVSTIRRIHQAPPELKPMDLDAVVGGVIENFPDSAIHYIGAHYQVRADDLLSVTFNNLIGNAVKHGGPGVAITVRVEEQGDEVLVTVEDTGPGVPDAEKNEIFRRYEKKKRGVGEGLGLYLVQILVERYGGRVWVEDRVPGTTGAGAAFRFTLKKVGK
ncbi:PAS domain S-box protein [Methanoculleus sediminis]|uniref:PAS domain S-box protein n=1 Tax=Methanoculleus sediminis TaxID=1550566 RepID=UPI0009E61738|nr:PAS domain S-box protein [Methanoculleus sediminis]